MPENKANIERNSVDSSSPTVTIVTVTYNAASTIGATMKSVASQVETDYEHIVMDGASTDKTLELVDSLKTDRTRVFSSADNGIYDAMNKSIAQARGRYVLFLNSGDTFADNGALARMVECARANRYPGVVYGQTVIVDLSGKVLGERHLRAPEELSLDSFKNGMVVCHQAFMARMDVVPLYDTDYRFSADYEWCIRCLQMSDKNVYVGDEPVIHYLNEGATTRNFKASLMERFKIMCEYYGTVSTVARHIRFAMRYARRRTNASNIQ